jgi:hypothetical protein|tara:strand:+ start:435 stop:551 length:117 start_codon:yes stop_codon:yes gene_type:complete
MAHGTIAACAKEAKACRDKLRKYDADIETEINWPNGGH